VGCLNCEVVERVNEFTVCTPIRAREDETPSFAVTVGFATAEIHNNIGDLREGANVVPNVGGGQSKSSSGDEGNVLAEESVWSFGVWQYSEHRNIKLKEMRIPQ
jgi:hypothetical protein